MTNSSQLLAEFLTNSVESRSGNVIEFLDGNYCETQKYIEELGLFRVSNFSCVESNVNELKQRV